jgi:hypothetical protein
MTARRWFYVALGAMALSALAGNLAAMCFAWCWAIAEDERAKGL